MQRPQATRPPLGSAPLCACDDPYLNASTNESRGKDFCAVDIPTSSQLFHDLPSYGYILIGFLVLFTVLTLLIYVDEIHFVLTHFRKETRKQKTIWILAFFPVFSTTGLLGCLVPRCGTLVDMVANVFFGTCLYNFGRLMVDYMGGPKRMWSMIEDSRPVHLNTPPCCCCCVCLPVFLFKRKLYFKITMLTMQVAIVRPILMFFAAVLWTNNSYIPGDMSLYNSFLYITLLNLMSTCCAMYGLMLLRGILRPELETKFAITGKIASLQLTLLCSAVPNVIIGILVATKVIDCGPIFPSKGRGEAIYHSFLVLMMLPFSLLGRAFYRRAQDGEAYAMARPGSTKVPLHPPPINQGDDLEDDEEEEGGEDGRARFDPPTNHNTLTQDQADVLTQHGYKEARV